jgi:hypothetical protein
VEQGGFVNPSSTDALNGALGLILTGGAIYLVIWLVVVFIASYAFYRIVRSAVRDGMLDADHKLSGGLRPIGGSSAPQYATAQVGAPPAPTYRGPGAQQ